MSGKGDPYRIQNIIEFNTFNSHQFPMAYYSGNSQKQKQMEHFENHCLHLNDEILNSSQVRKIRTQSSSIGAFSAYSRQQAFGKTVSATPWAIFQSSLEKREPLVFLTQFTIKNELKAYLQQATLVGNKKLLLETATEIMIGRIDNQDLSWREKTRLDRLKADCATQKSSFQPSAQPFIFRSMPTGLTGKYLIFITKTSLVVGCIDLYVWSPQGEILILFSGVPTDSASEAILSELRSVRSCFCVFLNTRLSDQVMMEYLDQLHIGGNQVIMQLPNPQFLGGCYLNQYETPKNIKIWVVLLDNVRFLLNSETILTFFLSGSFSPLQSDIIDMFNRYQQQLKKLGNSVVNQTSIQVLAIAYNMVQIDRAGKVDSDIVEKLWEIIEFLKEKTGKSAEDENQEFLNVIGHDHYPAIMSHCLKCRACKKNNKIRGKRNQNCPKSKYVCEGCTNYFGEKIHLCVTCFKKFHKRIKFFMEIKAKQQPKKISRARITITMKKNKNMQKEQELEQTGNILSSENEVYDTKDTKKSQMGSPKITEQR